MNILVTGGAGYVGSHLVRSLLDAGHRVAVVDDLSSGHREALPPEVDLHVGRCGDSAILDAAARELPPDAVMHVAARCSVSESVENPRLYYETNLLESLTLLDWMLARGVPWIVHSSTCAVYGEPERETIDESCPTEPVNPYGASKLAVDRAIGFYSDAYDMVGVSLRYFNAAGAHPDGDIGEDKRPASNLIPRLFEVALDIAPHLEVYGDDYRTPDGTGVRDYIHVIDLADAHLAALERLTEGARGGVYNLGVGHGHSVLEVLEVGREVTGHALPAEIKPRRPGDPPRLVSDAQLARRKLGWSAQRSDLHTLLADAWGWREQHPYGYGVGGATPEGADVSR